MFSISYSSPLVLSHSYQRPSTNRLSTFNHMNFLNEILKYKTLLACKQKHFVCVHSESCENIILAEEKSTRCHFRYFFWWSGLSRKLQQASFNINLRQQIHWIINISKILLLTISKLVQPWMLIRRSYRASKRTPSARLIQINFFCVASNYNFLMDRGCHDNPLIQSYFPFTHLHDSHHRFRRHA